MKSEIKPGFLLEAARQHAKSLLRTCLVFCGFALFVLLLNYKYVYNFVAGPFPLTAELAESPGAKEFAQAQRETIPTGIVERDGVIEKKTAARARKTTLRYRLSRLVWRGSLWRVTNDTDYYLVPVDAGKYVLVRTWPDFSGRVISGQLVPVPEKLRNISQLWQVKGEDKQVLGAASLCPTMLIAMIDYRADFNLFVLLSSCVLAFSLIVIPILVAQISNPANKYVYMMRLIARNGPVLPVVHSAEAEFIAAGDGARAGPLLISSSWIYDPAEPLLIPLKDVVAARKKVIQKTGKPPIYSIEFWLRGLRASHSIKAEDHECDAVLQALGSHVPWVIIDPGSSFAERWSQDQPACIAEMERRRRQQKTQ
jgi:hypothetical protein